MESDISTNSEMQKPKPVSLREVSLMTGQEAKEFYSKLTKEEKFDFQAELMVQMDQLPIGQKVEIAKARLEKLEAQKNTSISEKIWLWQARQYLKTSESKQKALLAGGKKPKETPFPKWIKEKHSPYLIKPSLK